MDALLKLEFKEHLENINSWWSRLLLPNGDIISFVDNDNNLKSDNDFCIILATRLVWFFSSYARYNKTNESLKNANQARDYLLNYFLDKGNGGFVWSIDKDKQFKDTKKQAYAQAFAVYALIEHYKLSNDEKSLQEALNTFEIIEKNFKELDFGGYIEALSKDFAPLEDLRLSQKDLNSPKSMNTHLHILEAYTSLYRYVPNSKNLYALIYNIEIYFNRIFDKSTNHLRLFFANNWEIQSSNISFGHEIEAAWLGYEAALVTGNIDLINKARDIAIKLSDMTLKYSISNDGAVYYEADKDLKHIDKNGEWWGQFEAMIGFYNSFEITNNQIYKNIIFKIWEYTKSQYAKNGYGEYTWYSARSQKTNQYLAGDWKCPYHNGRALIEIIKREEKGLGKWN